MRVLAVGCGGGGPCLELPRFENVFVVGIDADEHNVS
jgi:2-polyprenyl-3-methyl-5-hydroxy-6-metoxy-1,4-benzoquinol methylase